MLFIITFLLGLFLLCLACVFYYVDAEWKAGLVGTSLLVSIISGIILTSLTLTGAECYPKLRGLEAKAISLKSEVQNVKSAYYKEARNGTFIGGSLENMQQSSQLSEYIREYAYAKAEYNQQLTMVKSNMDSVAYQVFAAYKLFRSDKINDLKIIE